MRHSGRRRAPLARVAWVALAAALAGAGSAVAESQGDFVRLVAGAKRGGGDRDIEERAAQLARLPGALESYFEIVVRDGLPGPEGTSSTPLTSTQSRLLAETAARFDPARVVAHVETGLSDTPDTRWRVAALQLLGLHARSDDLPLLSRVALEGNARAPADEIVDSFQEALSAVLRRWGSRPQALSWLVDRSERLEHAVVRAVGQADDPEGLLWLADRVDDASVGMAALQEIGRLAPLASGELATETARRVAEVLEAQDENRRKQAIRALGALRDPASIPLLARVLEHGAPGERKMAHGALRAITGLTLPPAPTAWSSWYDAERRWIEQELEATLERLSSDDEAELVAAIRELSEHGLCRDRIALELAPLLAEHASPGVRGQVCLALGRLGSGVAVTELKQACDDEDPQVQGHARKALRAIGGSASARS